MGAKFYLVGGAVRDEILGLNSKDLDYSVEASSYDAMRDAIMARGGQIFVESPEYFTIRAKVPGLGASDFVLCRKEGEYSDGRHPDKVEMGSLMDDLARRDFTMNAIAKSEEGEYIDPFGGLEHMGRKLIRCVGSAEKRFEEDALRMIRAMRFSIVKGMKLSEEIEDCLRSAYYARLLRENISGERVREELKKCFKHDTLKSLFFLEKHVLLKRTVFAHGLWLEPTFKS